MQRYQRKKQSPSAMQRQKQAQGIVLPIALIMLVIISFAGLMAARNSASYEQFSNNMRTNQVARQAAEAALRYCERAAIDKAESTGDSTYSEAVAKVYTADPVLTNIDQGIWNSKSNWGSTGANLITVNLAYTNDVKSASQIKDGNKPTCIIESLSDDRYLVTSRGLSNDASVTDGTLTAGSEVWLQSILVPGAPIVSANNGVQ
ncbi:pilus assembly PilX family protein [Hydrogenophaga electricum]|uniref:Type 4 fimbrial biogenesis protein PilX N-terminal domain-containing protein n=1 Tax=Hydrogenophaga electricum TaxID=1230953 RepID=A0ABQ6C2P3_9BURK|nr:hypothetical protein [Hydrogenophaga electricum]GLS12621.1 hypothetical protein GCM10007935_00470 [Hydrogenophaga electricum]